MKQSRLRKWLWKNSQARRAIESVEARVDALERRRRPWPPEVLREIKRLEDNIEEVREMLGRVAAHGRYVPFADLEARK